MDSNNKRTPQKGIIFEDLVAKRLEITNIMPIRSSGDQDKNESWDFKFQDYLVDVTLKTNKSKGGACTAMLKRHIGGRDVVMYLRYGNSHAYWSTPRIVIGVQDINNDLWETAGVAAIIIKTIIDKSSWEKVITQLKQFETITNKKNK